MLILDPRFVADPFAAGLKMTTRVRTSVMSGPYPVEMKALALRVCEVRSAVASAGKVRDWPWLEMEKRG